MSNPPPQFNKAKLLVDLRDSLAVLDDAIAAFRSGKSHAYRPAAVELRKLLCDRENTLSTRIFPDLALHPREDHTPPEVAKWKTETGFAAGLSLALQLPAPVRTDGKGGYKVLCPFDLKARPVPLAAWLAQPFINAKITIEAFIRSVADKEGAHADADYNPTLRAAKSLVFVEDESHPPLIIALAEYAVGQIRAQLGTNAAASTGA